MIIRLKDGGSISDANRDALWQIATSSYPHAVMDEESEPEYDSWKINPGEDVNEFQFAHEVATLRDVIEDSNLTYLVEFEDVPDPIIRDLRELLQAAYDVEPDPLDDMEVERKIARELYENTNCGANVSINGTHSISVSSIIEGSDTIIVADPLIFPFRLSEYHEAVEYVESEVEVAIVQEVADEN